MSIAQNIEFLRRMKLNGGPLLDLPGLTPGSWPTQPSRPTPLIETRSFGSNPGDLRMFSFVPPSDSANRPLVVALHGCTQNAAGFDAGAGWSDLAKRYDFALLMPEQKPSNNAQGCFNWFAPDDTARGGGEVASIKRMIDVMVEQHHPDGRRVYITGLSAGGAMATAMLATYPETFAAGAIIAGLPYGVAHNVREALQAMMQPEPRPASELGDRVRRASAFRGRWPRLSVWHGTADRTVHPANADEIVKQWLDLHRLPKAPMARSDVRGHARQIWWNETGETMVESFSIARMAHGVPLGVGGDDVSYGAPGPFLIEAGISSSFQIAEFFGLTGPARRETDVKPQPAAANYAAPVAPSSIGAGGVRQETFIATKKPAAGVASVITRALTAAGLMK